AARYTPSPPRHARRQEAGVAGLQQPTAAVAAAGDSAGGLPERFAAAYLHPDNAPLRRLLAELHLAGRHDQTLGNLLARWHQAGAAEMISHLGGDQQDMARVKALFLLLLGICHLDDLPTLAADHGRVTDHVLAMARALEGRS